MTTYSRESRENGFTVYAIFQSEFVSDTECQICFINRIENVNKRLDAMRLQRNSNPFDDFVV